jgi:hypothetical protein
MRLQTPRHVQHVFFIFLRRVQRLEAFSDDDMTGGAGADLAACVFDI